MHIRIRPLGAGAFVLTFALAVWLTSMQGVYPSDDSLIHMRFAWNLAQRGELTFNAGERSFSTTSPLWNTVVGLTARAARVEKDGLLRFSRRMGIFWFAMAAAALLWLGRTLSGRWLLAGPLFFLLDPYVTISVRDAMEQMLFVTLGALGLALVVRGARGSRIGLFAAAALFAVQYAARPEALVFAAAAGLYLLGRGQRGRCGLFVGALILAFAPVLWLLHRELGSLVPLSLLMKTSDAHGWLPLSATATSWRMLELLVHVYAVPLLAVILMYWLALPDSRGEWWRRSALPLLVGALLAVAYLAFMKEPVVSSRYLVNFMPFGWIALGGLLPAIRPRFAVVTGVGLAMYLVTLNLMASPQRIARGRALEPERIELGTWLRQHTPPDASVWVFDIGYVGFYSERRIYDFNLIETPGYGAQMGLRKRRGELDIARAIQDNDIDYVIWGPNDLPALPLERVFTSTHEKAGRYRSIYRVVHADPTVATRPGEVSSPRAPSR